MTQTITLNKTAPATANLEPITLPGVWEQLSRDAEELANFPSTLGDKTRFLHAVRAAFRRYRLADESDRGILNRIAFDISYIDQMIENGNNKGASVAAVRCLAQLAFVLAGPRNARLEERAKAEAKEAAAYKQQATAIYDFPAPPILARIDSSFRQLFRAALNIN